MNTSNLQPNTSFSQEQLAEILKQTDSQALFSFLSQYAQKHPGFYQEFISSLHPKKRTTHPIDEVKEIQKCFERSYDNDDFPIEGEVIANRLDRHIEKAKSLIKLHCYEEAMAMLLLVIRKIGETYEEYDDRNGDLAYVCQVAAGLIAEMVEAGLPENILTALTDEIRGLIKNSNYDNYYLADLDRLLLKLSLKTSNFEQAINIIDDALIMEPDTFRTSSLVMSKIELLKNAGKEKEINKTISFYIYLPEIRKIRLRELTSEKQYARALALIEEGIDLAEEKKRSGTVADWKDEKLSVYRLMGNDEKVIDLAEDLFITGRESINYYHILKSMIPNEKWADYLDDFLCRSTKKTRWGLRGDVLTKIYIEEGYWERLMDYVEQNIRLGRDSIIESYESYLKPRFPDRMLAYYRFQIIDYASRNMGRDHYRYVSDVLKTMQKYPGGTEMVETLLAHFRTVYSNRRAMMEELGR